MHMLEDHLVDQIKLWNFFLGIADEQGGEATHAQLNKDEYMTSKLNTLVSGALKLTHFYFAYWSSTDAIGISWINKILILLTITEIARAHVRTFHEVVELILFLDSDVFFLKYGVFLKFLYTFFAFYIM